MDTRVFRCEEIAALLRFYQVQDRAVVTKARTKKSFKSIRGGRTLSLLLAYLSKIVSAAQLPFHLQFAISVSMVPQNL
jgi:hypothetical protein